jgi:hypothetical protein
MDGGEEMLRRSTVVLFGLALLLAWTPAALAQTVAIAQLKGVVTDESGGVLPGVDVIVTQTSTGMTRTAVTGSQGEFAFPSLPVGPYKLDAKMAGFNTFEQTGINLAVGDTRSVTVTLKVGAVTETIRVEADANLVETRSLAVGVVVQEDQLVGLPLNGRDATQLVLLSGGAVETGLSSGDRQPGGGGPAISVAGGTGNSTMYLVDGGYNNDAQNNSGNQIPFPDALQEFRAETGVRDARFGMSTGATVNAVTRSGTNQFHGSAFDFFRHHKFNSKNYFERTENGGLGRNDGLERHQLGGTFGGPVIQNQLFFFFGVQVTDNFRIPLNTDETVPTAEVLRGDFRRIMSAACRGGTARTLGWPFVNNQVDPALFHPISLAVTKMVPVADPVNDPDGCGRHVVARPDNQLDQQYVSRVDYQVTQNKRVFFRDFIATNTHPALWDDAKPNLLDTRGAGRGLFGLQHTIASGLDWVITQNLFSATRFSYQHTFSERRNNGCVPTWATMGVKTWAYTNSVDANGVQGCSQYEGQGQLKGGLWGSAHTGRFYQDTPSLSQDFDWTKGAHNISFGGSWTRPHADGDGTFAADGNIQFSGLFTSGTTQTNGGLNMADFMLGLPSGYTGSGSQINNAWVHAVGTYFNDSWRVNRRFTVNLGVRWEPFISVKDNNGFVTAFIRDNYEKGIRSTVYPNAPIGVVFRGDAGFPDDGGNSINKWAQIAPRAGLVWDPAGDNVQTIRVGAGLYFDSPKLWTTAHHMLNPPFGNNVSALPPTSCPQYAFTSGAQKGCPLDFVNIWGATPGGDPQANFSHQGYPVVLPGKDAAFPRNGEYVSMPVDSNPMETWQYNVSYQRQIMQSMLFDVTYTGSVTEHIWVSGFSENPAIYIPGNCVAGQYGLTAAGPCSNTSTVNRNARRLLTLLNATEGPYFGGTDQLYPDGDGRYNGVKFSLSRRMANNWSASTNYTLSKCINQGEPSTDIGGGSFPGIGNVVETGSGDTRDWMTERQPDAKSNEGHCTADRRHIFNLTSVFITPAVADNWLGVLTKDWQVGLIVSARSGSHITPTVNGDNALTNTPQRAVVVPGVDPYLPESEQVWVPNNNSKALPWLNPAAFTLNTPGTWGNAERLSLTGPSYWIADLAFSRNINFTGGRRVEVRVEAFNLFDHVNWANPSVQAGSTSATNGMITNTTGQARIMQFALRYQF